MGLTWWVGSMKIRSSVLHWLDLCFRLLSPLQTRHIGQTSCMNCHLMFQWHWVDRVNYLNEARTVPVNVNKGIRLYQGSCRCLHPCMRAVHSLQALLDSWLYNVHEWVNVLMHTVHEPCVPLSKCVFWACFGMRRQSFRGNNKFTEEAQLSIISFRSNLLPFALSSSFFCPAIPESQFSLSISQGRSLRGVSTVGTRMVRAAREGDGQRDGTGYMAGRRVDPWDRHPMCCKP